MLRIRDSWMLIPKLLIYIRLLEAQGVSQKVMRKKHKCEIYEEGLWNAIGYQIKCHHDCPAPAYKGAIQDWAWQLSITDNGGGCRALTPPPNELLVTDGLGGRRRHRLHLSIANKPTKLQWIVLNLLPHWWPWLNIISKQNKIIWVRERDFWGRGGMVGSSETVRRTIINGQRTKVMQVFL